MAIGVKALEQYEEGKDLTLKQSVLAKCAECMGRYADGPMDCVLKGCPLYPYMPYGTIKKKKSMKMDKASIERRKERGRKLGSLKKDNANHNLISKKGKDK